MAKLSVSVPDELWRAARGPAEQPSHVVQRALRLLVERSPGGSYRREPSPDEASRIAEVADRLAEQARWFFDKGYEFGVYISSRVAWVDLEDFHATPGFDVEGWLGEVGRELGGNPMEADDEDADYLVQELYEWTNEDPSDRLGDIVSSRVGFPATFSAGAAQAIEDVRRAVEQRIATWSQLEEPPPDDHEATADEPPAGE